MHPCVLLGLEDNLSTQELSVRKSATEVRKEGWLYRESGYVNGLVNPRYGAIYPHALVTFRRVGRGPNLLRLPPPSRPHSLPVTAL